MHAVPLAGLAQIEEKLALAACARFGLNTYRIRNSAKIPSQHPDGVTSQVSAAPAFASADEALEMLESALGYLAAVDATQLPTVVQARSLQVLERADAIATAARASVLAAFTAARGYCEDGDYSPRMWLITKTRITKSAAAGHLGWARRAAAHPHITVALTRGDLSESYARAICQWTGKIPPDCRDGADEILVAAARSGLDLRDVTALAAEIYVRSRPATPNEDADQGFTDRAVRLETTFQGAGGPDGRPDPRMRRGRDHGLGCAIRAERRRGHPHA